MYVILLILRNTEISSTAGCSILEPWTDWSRVRDTEPTKRNHIDMFTTSAKFKRKHVKNAATVRQRCVMK